MSHRTIRSDFGPDMFLPINVFHLASGVRQSLADVVSGGFYDVPDGLDFYPVYVEVPNNLVAEVRVGPKIEKNRAFSYADPTDTNRSVTIRNDFADFINVDVLVVGRGGLRSIAIIPPAGRFEVNDWSEAPFYVELHSQLVAELRIGPKVNWGKVV